MGIEVFLNGRTIALDGCLPLRIGDWKTIESRYGITPQRLGEPKFADLANLAFYVLRKADSDVKMDEIDNLLPDDPLFKTIADAASRASGGDAPKAPSS